VIILLDSHYNLHTSGVACGMGYLRDLALVLRLVVVGCMLLAPYWHKRHCGRHLKLDTTIGVISCILLGLIEGLVRSEFLGLHDDITSRWYPSMHTSSHRNDARDGTTGVELCSEHYCAVTYLPGDMPYVNIWLNLRHVV
jgi:hypothetical protein